MSDFRSFMKANKKAKQTIKYKATASLCDDKGEPLEWEIKAVTTKESEAIREACTFDAPIKGKYGMTKPVLNNRLYSSKFMCAAVVYPDLNNKELQDSYGVMTPEDLLIELIDNPAEYNDLMVKINEISGINVDINDKIKEAKN